MHVPNLPLPPQADGLSTHHRRCSSVEELLNDYTRPESGSGAWLDTLQRDAQAGLITGLMGIPLSVGICVMSDYPVQVGLATVAVACVTGFIFSRFRPGNHIGVPGIAAGLAPVLAMGVHHFGLERMPWLIFMTSVFQAIVWRFNLSKYLLKAVPPFLIEGLLAGVGLKIAVKFLTDTWTTVGTGGGGFWTVEREIVILSSVVGLALFLYLYSRFKDSSPGIPYIVVIVGGMWVARYFPFPMLHVEPMTFRLSWPWPDFSNITPRMHGEMVLYALMLMLIDVIEQVMSNAAIEQIDPLKRKSDSNNSLLTIWVANLLSSFFGGMTNLDGLAKSSTNQMAGAMSKTSCLFVAVVFGLAIEFPQALTYLPKFALAILMIFTGCKMIAGLYHVADQGRYAFGLATLCGLQVFQHGIFEGLTEALLIHSVIAYIVFKREQLPTFEILKKFFLLFGDRVHPHTTDTMEVTHDEDSGGLTYASITRSCTEGKSLEDFIGDWAWGINNRNLLSVVGTYDNAGMLWGTFAKELRSGHMHIKRYFEHLFELDELHVEFEASETRQYQEIYIKSGSYQFTYRKKGALIQVPARYSFVCKRELTGWYILEHHSSEFPG